MKIKLIPNNNIVYYALLISIILHCLFLCVSFGRSVHNVQNHKLNITIHTQNVQIVLPQIDNVGDVTQLKNNPTKQVEKSGDGTKSQYMISDKNSQSITMRYTDMIRQRIQEALVYPTAARKDGIEGKVYVRFVIDKNGNLLTVLLIQSSGSALLDDAAIKAIRKASPFPPIPNAIEKESMTFMQGLTFTLK